MMFPTDDAVARTSLRAWRSSAVRVAFFPEHTHIPASRESPTRVAETCRTWTCTPTTRSGAHNAAAATERLDRHGHLPVIQRDLIITAKEVASVDRLRRQVPV
jgi:hypothetical protein